MVSADDGRRDPQLSSPNGGDQSREASRQSDPTQRFSDRAEHYTRYRPGYPPAVLDVLRTETGLSPRSVVADIGSGTGISSDLFLRNGNFVWAVEPNAAMRSAAERSLATNQRFRSIEGTAENTTLASESVDYVVAGQAFHWFDAPSARREFARILRPDGWVALLWNDRREDSTAFLREYESLLRRFGTDYLAVRHRNLEASSLVDFFTGHGMLTWKLYNEQRLDLEGLKGRLLSSSYVPSEADPAHSTMLAEVERIFLNYEQSGTVSLQYDTKIFLGRLQTTL
ncbi:MAG: methyltransferase domain-containing protein [Gemmatimonas sp.]|nr:methyltransferase domain-containing protein [Gemmatimonas sp.]